MQLTNAQPLGVGATNYCELLQVRLAQKSAPVTEDELRRIIETFVSNYNKKRLHAAIGYLAPLDKLEGRGEAIHAARKAFLLEQRGLRRQRSA